MGGLKGGVASTSPSSIQNGHAMNQNYDEGNPGQPAPATPAALGGWGVAQAVVPGNVWRLSGLAP